MGAAESATNTSRPLTHSLGDSKEGLAVDATHTPQGAIALFHKRVPIPAEGGCLLFPTKPTARGYGQLQTGGRGYLAHRVAYEIAYGPIPQGMQVDHICHIRRCVNPSHLRLVTAAQNQQNRTGAQRTSTTGHRGVLRHRQKFAARVVVDGASYHGGVFDTAELAADAAARMRRRLMPFSEMDK